MSESYRHNNDYAVFANFLLSAGIVSPAGAANYGGNVQFLQQIGFCSPDAQTIAQALKAAANSVMRPPITPGHVPPPHAPGGGPSSSTGGPSSNPGGPVVVPLGWLVGPLRVQGGLLPLTATTSKLPPVRFP